MQKVAVGIQTLSKFRKHNYVYVDKTMWAYELVTAPAYYFLSRPRRFGKSLFLNTLFEIFSGNKALFEGTFIYDKIEWESFPIVHLSFEKIMGEDGNFSTNLIKKLNLCAATNDILIDTSNVKTAICDLIEGLHKKYNKGVVILIDEYDKPLLDVLGTPAEDANRTTMRYFFECLKELDAKIHFVFITGITKFSQVSLFSSTNNLTDLTLNKKYNAICGYTKQELEDSFEPQFQEIADNLGFTYDEMMEETKHWYNGYSWGREKIYNPFSIACLVENKEFKNYWFASGAPRFLIEVLYNNFNYDIKNVSVSEYLLATGFNSNSISYGALMFQTGYLTITNYDSEIEAYDLDYPNKEVEESLKRHLLDSFGHRENPEKSIVMNMHRALRDNDIADFVNHANQLFAQIPEPIFVANREGFYHAIIYLSLSLLGIATRSEDHTNKGRMDMMIPLRDRIFIIEYKIADSAGSAMAQIHAKKYYEKYLNRGKPITLIGIALGAAARGVVDWAAQSINI